jgi:hypothetical protein
MKNRTFKVIVILVGSLFLNIEAAHAGLIQKFKMYIGHEFPGFQLILVLGALMTLGFLTYVIFTPAFKENGRYVHGSYYSQEAYGARRLRVKKISEILRESSSVNQSHY